MAKTENQKLKILYIAQYFMENSDENHPVVASDIVDYLVTECGIETERHSVYRDIAALRDVFHMDIERAQGGKYRLMSRQFEYDDLLLLAECVHAAKFISAAKATELVDVISGFCSIYQAEMLQEEVFLCDRVKTTERGVLTNIATIRQAMAAKWNGKPHTPQKIRFQYTTHSIKDIHKRIDRRKGAPYTVSPYKLLLNEGNYYLLAFDSAIQEMRTYRIDRMKNIQTIDAPREGAEAFSEIDMATYTRRIFSMFSGQRRRVSIRFVNRLLDAVIERFGTASDVQYRPDGEQHFIVTVEVEISEPFYGWVCSFGTGAQILSPKAERENFKKYLESLQKLYEEEG